GDQAGPSVNSPSFQSNSTRAPAGTSRSCAVGLNSVGTAAAASSAASSASASTQRKPSASFFSLAGAPARKWLASFAGPPRQLPPRSTRLSPAPSSAAGPSAGQGVEVHSQR